MNKYADAGTSPVPGKEDQSGGTEADADAQLWQSYIKQVIETASLMGAQCTYSLINSHLFFVCFFWLGGHCITASLLSGMVLFNWIYLNGLVTIFLC